MEPGGRPGAEAIRVKGWLAAHRYLILRRISQLAILGLFLLGPLAGIWIVKGNMASSLTLDVLPLSDPLVLLQVFAAVICPRRRPCMGGAIVLAFYLLVGGRVYCSWVCPVNIVTDTAEWLRRKLNIKNSANFSDKTRYWLLGGILLVAAVIRQRRLGTHQPGVDGLSRAGVRHGSGLGHRCRGVPARSVRRTACLVWPAVPGRGLLRAAGRRCGVACLGCQARAM